MLIGLQPCKVATLLLLLINLIPTQEMEGKFESYCSSPKEMPLLNCVSATLVPQLRSS
ncbi:hypothetical protein A2U01_0065306, partial [Trifolium medium]|nr:hypothetical protein [Trifolium medium]